MTRISVFPMNYAKPAKNLTKTGAAVKITVKILARKHQTLKYVPQSVISAVFVTKNRI